MGDRSITVGFLCVDRGREVASPALALANTSPNLDDLMTLNFSTVPNSYFFRSNNELDASTIPDGHDIVTKCLLKSNMDPPLPPGFERRQIWANKNRPGKLFFFLPCRRQFFSIISGF